MIRVEDLSVQYGPVPALRGLSFTVQAGECVLVTGPSGCGKTTLTRVLAGLIPQVLPAQAQGCVEVAGRLLLGGAGSGQPETGRPAGTQPVGAYSAGAYPSGAHPSGAHPSGAHAPVSHPVGVVFQNPAAQLFHLSVEDEVAFGPRNLELAGEEVAARVRWALDSTGLSGLERRRPADLSGGQKQRLAIAAVLAMRPQVLVLDEPTASLDAAGAAQVTGTLQALRRSQGVTIVLVEHRLAEAAALAERVLVLDDGRLVAAGSPESILGDWELRRRYGLRRPVEDPPAAWRELVTPNGKPPALEPLLEMHNLSAGYNGRRGAGRRPVIQGIDLAIYPGEFVALVGDNGAGKTTLALAAAGLLKPMEGQVRCGPERCSWLGRGQSALLGQGWRFLPGQGRRSLPGQDVALLFQNPADQLFTDSVDEEVAFGPLNYRCFDPQIHERTLAEAGLAGLRPRSPNALSTGQQQRTALAACLALRPRLVILDEPTLGQDWTHLQRLMEFLSELNAQGTAILLITHDYKLVYRYARRVILMEAGRIVLDGKLQHREPAAA